ncbi:DUF6705 family protein [Chitinophaga ginsengisegetis]|uniref:DUF6705 family protein n=1 Tax=Chitinophaga ginsengisegetis TaxID=393003 RepID=UPI000DB8FBB1|nr:DUF6705 family protein [Chitinophaga ginsengisegetis]MDR6570727.1 hypothetical protein [Chitinophaga ginsengisegetis]MDR6650461.1 hypothetical protein [Chitinophaga ginsengisegetis]MDR6656900.1 hypothetical protein [Chitinophaga ginsengisegetis]
MKTIFFLAFMLLSNLAFAQKRVAAPELAPFAGTWEYTENNQTFRIELKLGTLAMSGVTVDVLEGRLIYSANKKVVQNTLDSPKPNITNGILADKSTSVNKVQFFFHDAVKGKNGDGFLEFVPGTNDKLLWTLNNREIVSSGETVDYGFSVPVKATLRKLK